MVFCIRRLNGAVENDQRMLKTRKMRELNEEAFLADIFCVCREQMRTETDVIGDLVNHWSYLFSSIIDKYAPITEMRVSEKCDPWIDKDLKNLCRPAID